MKDNFLMVPYIFLIVTWIANINDLIRGEWFYHSITSILVVNFFGILGLVYILIDKNEVKKR